MRMFVLKRVELVEVTDNSTVFFREDLSTPYHPVKPDEQDIRITEEMVNGRIFINERNEKVCFGISKEAEKMIGMSFDTIDSLSKQIEIDDNIIDTLKTKLAQFKDLTLIGRIKMVFKPIKLSCI